CRSRAFPCPRSCPAPGSRGSARASRRCGRPRSRRRPSSSQEPTRAPLRAPQTLLLASTPPVAATDPELSVVIPCLNEESAIAEVVGWAWAGIERSGRTGEVIVVDNGSTDRSVELATEAGARVVHEKRRGYGSAYLRGLAEARGRYIFMGDGDGTYDFRDLNPFLEQLDAGKEFVLGSRYRGHIHEGAMPWLHRRIGNPILTRILNLFF